MSECEDRSLRPSFREAISRAERQVGYREMEKRALTRCAELELRLIHEMCAIIAEVYMMDPGGRIRISGEWLDVYTAQEVLREITAEHVQAVYDQYTKVCESIRNKKAYLRTMLYNSVFSLEAGYENDFNSNG